MLLDYLTIFYLEENVKCCIINTFNIPGLGLGLGRLPTTAKKEKKRIVSIVQHCSGFQCKNAIATLL